jgi:hypothetical protein
LRAETLVTVRWIAARLAMGTASYAILPAVSVAQRNAGVKAPVKNTKKLYV